MTFGQDSIKQLNVCRTVLSIVLGWGCRIIWFKHGGFCAVLRVIRVRIQLHI